MRRLEYLGRKLLLLYKLVAVEILVFAITCARLQDEASVEIPVGIRQLRCDERCRELGRISHRLISRAA
jgi:hypothetical protein